MHYTPYTPPHPGYTPPPGGPDLGARPGGPGIPGGVFLSRIGELLNTVRGAPPRPGGPGGPPGQPRLSRIWPPPSPRGLPPSPQGLPPQPRYPDSLDPAQPSGGQRGGDLPPTRGRERATVRILWVGRPGGLRGRAVPRRVGPVRRRLRARRGLSGIAAQPLSPGGGGGGAPAAVARDSRRAGCGADCAVGSG